MDDTNELVTRLTTAAGILMEDHCPVAFTPSGRDGGHIADSLDVLEQATRDANLLVRAAQALVRRNIR